MLLIQENAVSENFNIETVLKIMSEHNKSKQKYVGNGARIVTVY